MSNALPFRATSSSSSRSRRFRSILPPRFLVRVVTLVVWPVSKPETEMDFWNSTQVSCCWLPPGVGAARAWSREDFEEKSFV